ncbi:hypothetical protein BKA70DRAFT_1437421 [Coprinopsis sp. MPI-PUGE-AT-0042]|nr:hypothetical protein BKA70DRAFT_1437421 [Coprinopsis sp. MPI-PUGE-AT-0042]
MSRVPKALSSNNTSIQESAIPTASGNNVKFNSARLASVGRQPDQRVTPLFEDKENDAATLNKCSKNPQKYGLSLYFEEGRHDYEVVTRVGEDEGLAGYQQRISAVQEQMGLQHDDATFHRVQVAVWAAARKLALMCRRPLSPEQASANDLQRQALKFERTAWWVRDTVPIATNHQHLLQPVTNLLEIRYDEIKRREDLFRQRNGSRATLPDFSIVLEQEDANSDH